MNNIYSQLNSLPLFHIIEYVTANGWVKDGEIGNIASVWHREEAKNFNNEIIIPESKALKDYDNRIYDILISLSEFEKRTPEDIFVDISNFFSDIVKVRVAHNDVDDGSIPVDDGIVLIEKAKEMITSVSLSSIEKKKHFLGAKPQEVSDFLNNLRLGQTESGSFIVNLVAPIEKNTHENKTIEDLTSFTRTVSTNLASSLEAVTNAINNYDNYGNISVFEESISKGVSANLCDALIGLSGKKRHRVFSISINLANIEEYQGAEKLVHEFHPRMMNTLEKASKHFKENYVIPNYKLCGFVKKLEQEVSDEYGLVSVIVSLNNKDKLITFELEPDDYHEAIHAHETKNCVECIGDLQVSPRSAKLLEVHDFKVIRNGELF